MNEMKGRFVLCVLLTVTGMSMLPLNTATGGGIVPASLQYTASQMERASVKIYEKIGDVTFTYDSDSLTYHVYFGLAFPTINGSQRIAAYVYLLTDGSFITNAEVSLTYALDIQYNGKNITRSGAVSDSTSFMLWGTEVYGFEMLGEDFAAGEFPMTMDIDLGYTLSSSDLPSLSKTDTYVTSRYFFSPDMDLWVLIVIIGACAGGVVIIIAAVVVHNKKKRGASVRPAGGMVNPANSGNPFGPVNPTTPVSP